MDEYGHFIGCIEQPTPMPEGDLQMLRLGVSRRNKEDEVLWAIEDLIGESQSWPGWIRGIFWMDHLRDVDSLRLVTFCMGNGLPPHLLFQWLRVRRVKHNPQKLHEHLKKVRSSMDLEPSECKFFYWDLAGQEYCLTMDTLEINSLGRPRHSKKPHGPIVCPFFCSPWAMSHAV